MGIRLDKPWLPLDADEIAALPGMLGVYEIADADGTVVRVGCAGGNSMFGLRGELGDELDAAGGEPLQFRVEINQQYLTRRHELLMVHLADHGRLPTGNEQDDDAAILSAGRLSPG